MTPSAQPASGSSSNGHHMPETTHHGLWHAAMTVLFGFIGVAVVSHAMWRNSSQIIWRKRVIDLRETVTGDSQRSDLTDDQVLACGLDL